MKFLLCLVFGLSMAIIFLAMTFYLGVSLVYSSTDKISPFECGFQAISMSFFPFSLPFFMVSLLFLLFDVEILLVCLYPIYYFSLKLFSLMFFIILAVIFFTTLYEWQKGVLAWV